MHQLEPPERRLLLEIARKSVESAVWGERPGRRWGFGPSPEPDVDAGGPLPPALLEPSAAFVTIRENGELRGCIGLLRFDVPLWENVREAAAAAALDDPRFYSVTPDELPKLDLEVSVLEPPVEIADPALFRAGRHGIIIEKGSRRGLLLPQVAPEMGWGELEMLDGVCAKAGLPPGAWRDRSAKLYIFESTCFGESGELVVASTEGEPSETAAEKPSEASRQA